MSKTDHVEETLRKMEQFIKEYNEEITEAIEEKKKELRLKLKMLIRECARKLEDEELVEKVYQRANK